MAKAAESPANLVIVESPTKTKSIQKYLGKNYEVVASKGHVRDLPKSTLGVDVEKGFEPRYLNIKKQADIIKMLKAEAKGKKKIYLATDPDREGEAISWHLAHILKLDLNDVDRVTFSEITKSGVKEGMAHPRKIDMDLVNAQQARRILDRIVGYKISPFLWKKIQPGLSAGRVQSVAVRIIVDRENEIRAFQPEEYWTIDAKLLAAGSKKAFPAKFYGKDGKKVELRCKEDADAVLAAVKDAPFTAFYHLYPAAGGFPEAGVPFPAHHGHGAGALRRRGAPEAGGSGSDHLYAYRLPADLRRSERCGGGVHQGQVRG